MSWKADVQGFDIAGKSAVIVGCGGLGTNASVHLAGAGIGRLLLIDFDTVEARNLNRQFLYTPGDIGREKCAVLKERLSAYAPETLIDCHFGRFEDGLAAGYDIVVIAVDNVQTRRQVSDSCVQSKTACVNGSINGFFGTAYLYAPGLSPDLDAAGCLNETGVRNLSPSTTAAVIGALEAQLAVDYFLGRTESAGKLFVYDNNEIQTLVIKE